MNKKILTADVQAFIDSHLNSDPHALAMAKSPFEGVTSAELAGQIAAKKKASKKLPTWFGTAGIYYPAPLSIEQTSSEVTAAYKASLVSGGTLLDLTAGFGVDDFYFAHHVTEVLACEFNEDLAEIHAYNAGVLAINNIKVLTIDGVSLLNQSQRNFDVIYLDPARRSTSGKVFKLADCTPDVTGIMDLLLAKGKKILIKTAPLLDITAGLAELKNVSVIYILSVKNECKELLWVLSPKHEIDNIKITCVTLNETTKHFSFGIQGPKIHSTFVEKLPAQYLYEPDAALLKSGAFNLIGKRFGLKKLHAQTHLYASDKVNSDFPGRIFKINRVLTTGELKKERDIAGNVIVRNYPEKAEIIVKKYKIKPSNERFLIFATVMDKGYVFDCVIIQYY